MPTVAFLGFEDAARCCITCGANHGKIGTGVVALFVNAINGNGVSRAIDADKIRVTVFALDVKILIALGFFSLRMNFFLRRHILLQPGHRKDTDCARATEQLSAQG